MFSVEEDPAIKRLLRMFDDACTQGTKGGETFSYSYGIRRDYGDWEIPITTTSRSNNLYEEQITEHEEDCIFHGESNDDW